MENSNIIDLLNKVKNGEISVDIAANKLQISPFEDLGFAKVDHHRAIRQGVCEVIYGQGKTKEQILQIATAMIDKGTKNILATRLSPDKASYLNENLDFIYYEICNIGIISPENKISSNGSIVVVSGGTSDIKVAEEAAVTAEALGNKVIRIYDAGVSGLHRLLSHMDILVSARVIIAVAGMEGALASVVGGLVSCPVIAVPTSIGYGANFGGISALLSMLNSCSSGISVVNIDNGFGAGYIANLINNV
jgi:NCAIR mutase (PurE)-related protein